MTPDPLFSVIILHYNQENLLYNAIDSVLNQTYENIEIILADDSSQLLNKQKVEEYINKNKKSNIKDFVMQINEVNLGTVQNANNAIGKCKGEYILMFAADDALYDENTVDNFVKSFRSLPEDRLVVSAQCYMYDEKLDKVHHEYVDLNTAYNLNNMTAEEQYKKMVFSCIYAMGATAFKRKIFEEYGLFNERYTVIEDWSYFLFITRSGAKITFINFGALKHRDGGVSHYKRDGLPPHVISFKNDLLLIAEYEIIPYLSILPIPDQAKLLEKYENERNDFYLLFVPNFRKKRITLIAKNPRIYLRKAIWSFLLASNKGFLISLASLVVLFFVWGITGLLSSGLGLSLSSFRADFAMNSLNRSIFVFLECVTPYLLIINFIITLFFGVLIILYGIRRVYKKYFTNKL